jgi:hypothetical protein
MSNIPGNNELLSTLYPVIGRFDSVTAEACTKYSTFSEESNCVMERPLNVAFTVILSLTTSRVNVAVLLVEYAGSTAFTVILFPDDAVGIFPKKMPVDVICRPDSPCTSVRPICDVDLGCPIPVTEKRGSIAVYVYPAYTDRSV